MREPFSALLAFGSIVAAALLAEAPTAQAQVAGPAITGYGYYPYAYAYYPPYGWGDNALPYAGAGPYTPAEDYYRAYDTGLPVVTYTYAPVDAVGIRPAYRTGRYLVRRGVTIARNGSAGRYVRSRRTPRR